MKPILIDTNVLVYSYDYRDPARQAIAIKVLETLITASIGQISAQSLSEFFSAVTRQKGAQDAILPVNEAIQETSKLARALAVYPVTSQIVLEALRGVRQYKLSFWDAQIWAAARLNQVSTIFTQDFQDGMSLESVQFINPFSSKFQLSQWLEN